MKILLYACICINIMQEHSVAKLQYFLPTGEQDGKISNTHHSFVLIIKPTKKELNALQDHQLSRENCNSCLHVCNMMCISSTQMHGKELPAIYSIAHVYAASRSDVMFLLQFLGHNIHGSNSSRFHYNLFCKAKFTYNIWRYLQQS